MQELKAPDKGTKGPGWQRVLERGSKRGAWGGSIHFWDVELCSPSRPAVKVKVAQSCPTLCNPMDCTVHGILQARIPEWVAFPFSRGSSNPGIQPKSPTLQADSLPAELREKPKNTGVGSLSLLQQLFPIQELNRGLLHCRRILYQAGPALSQKGRALVDAPSPGRHSPHPHLYLRPRAHFSSNPHLGDLACLAEVSPGLKIPSSSQSRPADLSTTGPASPVAGCPSPGLCDRHLHVLSVCSVGGAHLLSLGPARVSSWLTRLASEVLSTWASLPGHSSFLMGQHLGPKKACVRRQERRAASLEGMVQKQAQGHLHWSQWSQTAAIDPPLTGKSSKGPVILSPVGHPAGSRILSCLPSRPVDCLPSVLISPPWAPEIPSNSPPCPQAAPPRSPWPHPLLL